MTRFVIVVSFLLAFGASLCSAGQILTSPVVTNWGVWGAFEKCPAGSKVVAFQVKTEPWNAADIILDDTCLNGIKFFCGNPGSTDYTGVITSTVGQWGEWGNVYHCNGNGFVTGFMLRSVEEETAVVDESATNNIRILCSGSDNGFVELDGERWGEWTNPRICDSHEYVCGLQTQVEAYQGITTDDTSLNNIKVECCDLTTADLIKYRIPYKSR